MSRSRYRTGTAQLAPGTREPAARPPPSPGTPGGIDILPAKLHLLRIPDAVLEGAGAANWHQLNPSLVVLHGRLVASIRLCHPRLWIAGGGRANVIAHITDDFTVGECQVMKGVEYEDLRLFTWPDDTLSAIGGFALPGKQATLALLNLDNEGALIEAHIQVCPQHEKNWMPVVMDGVLRVVYRCDPLIVLTYSPETDAMNPSPGEARNRVGPKPVSGDGPRGSSQLLPYEGGWLAVVHELAAHKILYTHRLARFNADLTQVALGKPFVFEHEGIEFCCGLARWNGRWILSYGLEDKDAKLAVVTDDVIWGWAPEAPWMHSPALSSHLVISAPAPAPETPRNAGDPIETTLRVADVLIPPLPGWCCAQKARNLVQLVIDHRPDKCVELGVFGGRSLLAIAIGLKHNGVGHVDGVDPYDAGASLEHENEEANRTYWGSLPYETVFETARAAVADYPATIIRARSQDVVGNYEDGSLGLIHQDGNHSEEVSTWEVGAWLPKLKPGGLWVFDDADWVSLQAAQYLLRQAGCIRLELHKTELGTWAVYQKAHV